MLFSSAHGRSVGTAGTTTMTSASTALAWGARASPTRPYPDHGDAAMPEELVVATQREVIAAKAVGAASRNRADRKVTLSRRPFTWANAS